MKNLKVRNKLNLILLCMAVMILTAGICAIKGLNDVRNHADEVLEEAVRMDYDKSIKEEVENAISVLDQYNAKYEAGEYSLEEAEKLAAEDVYKRQGEYLYKSRRIFKQLFFRKYLGQHDLNYFLCQIKWAKVFP